MTRDEWVEGFVFAVVDANVDLGALGPDYLSVAAKQRWALDGMLNPKEAATSWIAARSTAASPKKNSTMKGRQ